MNRKIRRKEARFQPATARQHFLDPSSDTTHFSFVQPLSHASVLGLQRHIGNRAVRHMIGQYRVQRAVIQRAIGFEFETGAAIFDANPRITDDEKQQVPIVQAPTQRTNANGDQVGTFTPFAKGVSIYDGNHFELQADESSQGGADVEFVTTVPPFEENAQGKRELSQTMREIEAVGDFLLANGTVTEGRDLAGLGGTVNFPNAVIESFGGMEGNPQTTAGIRLDQLADFMMAISGSVRESDEAINAENERYDRKVAGVADADKRRRIGRESNQRKDTILAKGLTDLGGLSDATLMEQAVADARAAITTFKTTNQNMLKQFQRLQKSRNQPAPNFGSKELQGFVSMLFIYLRKGDGPTLSYAKSIAPLMARTDLGTMFEMLPEKAFFKLNPGQWMNLIFNNANVTGGLDDPIYTNGIGMTQSRVLDALTRRKWLMSLTNGIDLLTQAYAVDAGDTLQEIGTLDENKDELESLGSLGTRTEQVGSGKKATDAPIFEMRRMTQRVPYKQWHGLALDVFDYIVTVNKLKKASYNRKNRNKDMG